MGTLFGTDGIRGRANQYPITPEMAVRIGRAVVDAFPGNDGAPSFIIGKDSRSSGTMLEHAVAAGICSASGKACLAGVIPTPAVAVLTKKLGADGGIVISASHNPYHDNGIKLFNARGFKLDDDKEREVENRILDDQWQEKSVQEVTRLGEIEILPNASAQYIEFLKNTVKLPDSFRKLKVVVDCSNGATARIAPDLISSLGATVFIIGTEPDGININEGCGSEHPEAASQKVLQTGSDIGLAFDGDGDRLIAIAENGEVVSGDQIIAILAQYFKNNGRLSKDKVVSTVMSNMGLSMALESLGIGHETAGVGDRYVMQKMVETGAVLGGEDSGHMIIMDHHTTGDGILTALTLIEAMGTVSKPLSEMSGIMTAFPQVLLAVDVKEKPPLSTLPNVQLAIQSAEDTLEQKGRVLVRYSGTQPVCRVMVEGPTKDLTNKLCNEIADAVKGAIGI